MLAFIASALALVWFLATLVHSIARNPPIAAGASMLGSAASATAAAAFAIAWSNPPRRSTAIAVGCAAVATVAVFAFVFSPL